MSEGLRQPVFTALQLSPPTTAGQTWRTEPNKHFSLRNANTASFPNRLQKSGVSSPSAWFKVQECFTNKTRRRPYMGRSGNDTITSAALLPCIKLKLKATVNTAVCELVVTTAERVMFSALFVSVCHQGYAKPIECISNKHSGRMSCRPKGTQTHYFLAQVQVFFFFCSLTTHLQLTSTWSKTMRTH